MSNPSPPEAGDEPKKPDKVSRSTDQYGGSDLGMRVISILIAGMVFYGAIGWVLDHFLNTVLWLPIGLIVGTALGIYWVYKKYGQTH